MRCDVLVDVRRSGAKAGRRHETVLAIERHPEAGQPHDPAVDSSVDGAFDSVRSVVRAEQWQIEAVSAELAAESGNRGRDAVDARKVDVREVEDGQAGSPRGAPV